MQTPRKAYVETYGCQMNVSDGELMQGILAAQGFSLASSPEEADVILVNTCAIRDHAEQRVIGRVGDLYRIKRDRPGLVIGVTGCMAQRLGEKLLTQAAYVDLVLGPDAYRQLPEAIARVRPEWGVGARERTELPVSASVGAARSTSAAGAQSTGEAVVRRALPVVSVPAAPGGEERLALLEFQGDENYEGLEVRRASRVSAWVPVQRGCDYRCTYCIVPYVRGPEKNRDPRQVLAEVRDIAAQGITEVVLLGQTVNSWNHGEWTFARLVRAVANVDGIRRVRFTSPHPNAFTPELVAAMAEEPNVCRQLHLPVQSGHDRTLRRMLRRYTVAEYLDRIAQVRAAVPGISLSTDIIVGFPGESEAEFQATLALLREVRYDDAFLYRYSPRDGTPATRLPPGQFVPDDVAQARLLEVIDLHRSIQAEINRAALGSVEEVLIERAARSAGDLLGRTSGSKVVAFPGDASRIGRYAHVQLTATTGATFRGVAVAAAALV
ncbi:MAG TPA: MiaB/RimO family radical SAM methylthiotransferase [Longimicrobiales bacterium]|nr:MiaB/RimO family radical SAM methylthiotransferase [Longimicrobiales bacterium]